MDGFIALIVIVAIFNALTSSGRKKKRGERTRAQTDTRGAQPQAARREQRSSARESRAPIPYTREEWAKYMRDIDPMKVGQASNAASARGKAAPTSREDLRPAEPKVVAPAPVKTPDEGSVSTQGESAAEHAEHLRRVAIEEAERRQARETLRDLREFKRDSLRAAVVMREVLDRPVSLRARTGYHR